MKFGELPIDDAAGAILAHSHKVTGGVLKKGRVLSADDVAALKAAERKTVIVARLEPGDIGEDAAAERVANAIAGTGVRLAAPFTGRANIFSDVDGLAVIEADLINRLNVIDEALTVATVPPYERVEPGQMLATVKVITFAVAENIVEAAEAIAAEQKLISCRPFQSKSTGLIITKLPGTKPSILAKRRQVMADRLTAMGNSLAETMEVAHDADAVRKAISELKQKKCDPILVFAASAIVDRGDVVPLAIEQAGGKIVHLGMPVDPGNLLLLGRLDNADVIGVPSCAGSPKLNGFDWVLERRFAGLEVSAHDISQMGVGGLLKEIALRPQARDSEEANGQRSEAAIGCVVLAAGQSTRMGEANKLLADVEGKAMIRRVVEVAIASRAKPVVVVTGHQASEIKAELSDLDVNFVHNADYQSGMASSVRTGIGAMPRDLDGALVVLGDMPLIRPPHLDKMISAFAPKEGRSIVVPTYEGKRGNPILWSAEFFAQIQKLSGDVGARGLIVEHGDQVVEVEIGSAAVTADIDTPERLAALRRELTEGAA